MWTQCGSTRCHSTRCHDCTRKPESHHPRLGVLSSSPYTTRTTGSLVNSFLKLLRPRAISRRICRQIDSHDLPVDSDTGERPPRQNAASPCTQSRTWFLRGTGPAHHPGASSPVLTSGTVSWYRAESPSRPRAGSTSFSAPAARRPRSALPAMVRPMPAAKATSLQARPRFNVWSSANRSRQARRTRRSVRPP